jgi:septal ring factor EnvC (AmiA/AmiB activator)
MNFSRVLMILVFGMVTGVAHADVYKCVDENGRLTYTNDKPLSGQKGCVLLSRDQPVTSVPMPKKAATPTPSSFPRVDDSTQRARDGERRKILEQELSSEESLLADAQKELATQEAVRNGDEKNYQRVLDRLQPFRDKVKQHETNIAKLKTEINNIR